MRLIDADALKEQFKDRSLEDFTHLHFIDAIDNAPTVEQKKGKWIVAKQDCHGIHEIECPFCKYNKGKDFNSFITITFDVFPPFCEKCGADLRGEEE